MAILALGLGKLNLPSPPESRFLVKSLLHGTDPHLLSLQCAIWSTDRRCLSFPGTEDSLQTFK